jgi:WD40 repeat protein
MNLRTSELRHIWFNDDQKTFLCLYAFPAKYHILSISPFDIIRSQEIPHRTFANCASARGFEFIALVGMPADPQFDARSVLVVTHRDSRSAAQDLFLHEFDQYILTVRLTPEHVICGFFDHVELWSLQSGSPCIRLKCAINVHAPLDVSPVSANGRFVVCTGETNALDVCIHSLDRHQSFQSHAADNPVSLLTFSSRPQYFASASSAGHTIKIWITESNQCAIKFKRSNTAAVIYSVSFSPTNEFLVVLSKDGNLHFFSMEKAVAKGAAPTIRAFHNIQVGDTSVAFVAWFTSTQIAIVNMEGRLLVVSIDARTCREFGREQILFQQRILEKYSKVDANQ